MSVISRTLIRGVLPPKQSDGEFPVMLDLWEVQSTHLLPSLPGPLWPGMVAPDRVLSMGQIELTFKLCTWTFKLTYVKLNSLKYNFDYLTVCK